MKYFLHIVFTLSLLFVGEYLLVIIFQAAFISTFLNNKKIFYLLHIPIFFFALAKIFASSSYLLYFINLVFLFIFLDKNELLFSWKELLMWSFYISFLYMGYFYLEETLYDFYILLNVENKVNHLFTDVLFLLTLLHLLIFVILRYNKKKLFRM